MRFFAARSPPSAAGHIHVPMKKARERTGLATKKHKKHKGQEQGGASLFRHPRGRGDPSSSPDKRGFLLRPACRSILRAPLIYEFSILKLCRAFPSARRCHPPRSESCCSAPASSAKKSRSSCSASVVR